MYIIPHMDLRISTNCTHHSINLVNGLQVRLINSDKASCHPLSCLEVAGRTGKHMLSERDEGKWVWIRCYLHGSHGFSESSIH